MAAAPWASPAQHQCPHRKRALHGELRRLPPRRSKGNAARVSVSLKSFRKTERDGSGGYDSSGQQSHARVSATAIRRHARYPAICIVRRKYGGSVEAGRAIAYRFEIRNRWI